MKERIEILKKLTPYFQTNGVNSQVLSKIAIGAQILMIVLAIFLVVSTALADLFLLDFIIEWDKAALFYI
ncbi:MAG: hypothetical protein WBA74_25450, partial [Cyclobacteriaceae bacterium]